MKVADVGEAKHENEITGTICGTSIYLAPEVFENRMYNGKADIYIFGCVLWELWYSETAFGADTAKTPQNMVLEEVTKRNVRPTHTEGTQHPWRNDDDDDDLYFALFTLNLHYICRSKL